MEDEGRPEQQQIGSTSTMGLWLERDNDSEENNQCGACHFYPKCLQKFATPRSFLVCFCIKNILQGMIFTYIVGIETSLERHFQFDGKTIGLLLTLGELSNSNDFFPRKKLCLGSKTGQQ